MTYTIISLTLYQQFSEVSLGIRYQNRNAFSLILPIRIYTSVKLSCFRRVLYFRRALVVKSRRSVSSLPLRHNYTAIQLASYLTYRSHYITSINVPLTIYRYTYSLLASPPLGSWRLILSLPRLFLSRQVITLQVLRMSSPFFITSSRASKSVNRLLRQILRGGMLVSILRFLIGVLLQALIITRRYHDYLARSFLVILSVFLSFFAD